MTFISLILLSISIISDVYTHKSLQEGDAPPPKQKIVDPEELAEYRLRKRRSEFLDGNMRRFIEVRRVD
jgi:hypothetical protein